MKNKRSLSIDLSVKIKTTFILLSLFASICIYAQEDRDFGVGTFTLQMYYYPARIFSTDSITNILAKRIYYVKHSKVIDRQIGVSEKIQQNAPGNVTKSGELDVKSRMTAVAMYPTFLADYKNDEYFMYFERSKKSMYYRDSLKNHPEDLYKPNLNYKPYTIIEIKGGEITIAGKRCSLALAIKDADTTRVYYTKEKLNFTSPLNKPGINHSILGIQAVEKDGNAFGLFIVDIKEEELPNEAFTIPATAQVKTWDEVMNQRNSP